MLVHAVIGGGGDLGVSSCVAIDKRFSDSKYITR